MTADDVVSKSGTVLVGVDYLTVGNESERDESLVATQNKEAEQTAMADVLLYAGIGVVALAAIAGIALVVLKKKKAGTPAQQANKE